MPQGKGTYGNKQGRPAKKKVLPRRKGETPAKKKVLPKIKGETPAKKKKKTPGVIDLKEKYKDKPFTPLFGRGDAYERHNTEQFARDLDNNRKAKNKARLKKVKAAIGKIAKKVSGKK
ncbi:hypothetical protein [uncultured Mediterranean phage uvMED]|nr:hypothetical protein [uncultured Mediterranean phage uvMED]BAR22506.1 hypothetical protein [uncultured Mediterranean phage uvMED]